MAVPQYQKAVEKSQASQAIMILRNAYEAYDVFYLANGTYPTRIEQLDISPAWQEHTQFFGSEGSLSNDDWTLALHAGSSNSINGICVGRLRGNYAGTGFCMWKNPSNVRGALAGKIYCIERKAGIKIYASEKGSYCQKKIGAVNELVVNSNRFTAYEMPS